MTVELSTLGSVIKTAYEAEADTNAFTDAEKTKLAGVEAAADVTDTANVTAAGALMDSEVTNLAAVKAFDPTDYATAAQGATADTALQNVVEDTTPQLGGDLDAQGNNVTDLGDVTFQTGAAGGTLRTGTSAADKFTLQAYDVDGAAYVTVLEADAGNTVRLQLPVDYLELEDATDLTKKAMLDASGITTGTTRTFTFPDASGTFALSDNIEGTAIKSTGEAGGTKFLREDGDGTCSWQSVPASGGDLLADGTVPLTANWDVGSFDITAEQFHSDVTTGTAPFTVASTTVVANLNADLLDGNEAAAFAAAAHNHDADYISVVGTPTAGNFPQLTAGGELVNSAYDETSFATAAQGSTADTAVQPGDDAADLGSGAATDGYVLTADGAGGAAWEAAAAGSGDFKADGTVDMTGEFRTDVGTFDSDVADGASAVAYSFDTQNTYSTSGAKLASWKNNGTEKAYIDKDGVINVKGASSGGLNYAETSGNFSALKYNGTVALVFSGATFIFGYKMEPSNDNSQYLGRSARRWSDVYSNTVHATTSLSIASGSTVAGLPGSPVTGDIARVTDASAPAVGSTVTGGGAAAALVWYNGSNWTVIGV